MYVNKNFNFKFIWQAGGVHLVWITAWISLIGVLYYYFELHWIAIPWIAVGVVGTAVSFYIGFKNNQAYDRLWEARKIWGGLVNLSRMWGSNLRGYLEHQTDRNIEDEEQLNLIIKKMIYRHISYLYRLRHQLLIPTPWEHISLNSHVATINKKRMKSYGIGMYEDDLTEQVLTKHLDSMEYEKLMNAANMATQIIDVQSQELKQLKKNNTISEFQHIALQNLLNDFYSEQGKAERIKKFPLPRQYANASLIFVAIFIFLLPFGMVAEFAKLGSYGLWLFIPVASIIGWMFLLMELVGDYTENPFEGLGNDIPMLSICRTIEIDLKQMINDSNVPEQVQAINGVLM
jgi:putative membrane protein